MRRFVILMAVVISVALFSGAASAHTGLSSSSPAKNTVSNRPVTEIVLDFNTRIEPVSRITVTNENGEEIALKEVSVTDARLTGQFSEPLANGAYTVTWRIIGADGHAVSGSYAFAVDVPEASESDASESPVPPAEDPEQSAAPSSPDQTAVPSAPDQSPAPAETAEAPIVNDAQDQSSNTGVYLLGAAALVLVGAIIISLRIRSKR